MFAAFVFSLLNFTKFKAINTITNESSNPPTRWFLFCKLVANVLLTSTQIEFVNGEKLAKGGTKTVIFDSVVSSQPSSVVA